MNNPKKMKHAGYKRAIEWIAENDEPRSDSALKASVLSVRTTIMLVAELFGVSALKVATDVVRQRLPKPKDFKRNPGFGRSE